MQMDDFIQKTYDKGYCNGYDDGYVSCKQDITNILKSVIDQTNQLNEIKSSIVEILNKWDNMNII